MPHVLSRRHFLKTASAGAAVMATSAASYARVVGANERIGLAQIGCGDRGSQAHMLAGIHPHDKAQNVEYVAVCDPWRVAREKAAAQAKEWYGREPQKFVSYRQVLEMKEVDAVMIASCDHQHTTHMEAAAKAGKDIYCEKPLAKDFNRLKSACDAVKSAGVVAQIGTQLRSYPTFTGCRDLYKTGILGKVSRIEQCRNSAQPYWYSYVKREVKEEDVDWNEFLMDLPKRPFNATRYSGWYGYRETSDGPVPGFASHYIDLVHYITGAKFPSSCVGMGSTFTWKDEYQFTCPDHVQATWTYPEGFMVSYSTNMGNSAGSSFKIFGDQGVLDMVNWNAPILSAEGGSKNKGTIRGKQAVTEIPRPDHFLDFLQCLRTRKTPNASIDAGYQHAVAVIMAVIASDTGRRQVYDAEKREIREG